MKSKAYIVAALALAIVTSAGAKAGGSHDDPHHSGHSAPPAVSVAQHQSQSQGQKQTASSKSSSASRSNATSESTSVSMSDAQGGAGGDGGDSNATTNATTGAQSVGISDVQVRQTPPAFAGTVQPTASCKNAINGGASAPIAGVSFGFGKGDDECDLRETSRLFYEMGRPDLAVALLCASKAAKRLPTCSTLPAVVAIVDRDPGYDPGEGAKRAAAHGFPDKVQK